ncbi:MAG: hypothetical protein NTZ26_01740 [Candidatus Aminicenantes bacterium]|nr:hypothetical protein [Candidatus Aminicenantes bacterium]
MMRFIRISLAIGFLSVLVLTGWAVEKNAVLSIRVFTILPLQGVVFGGAGGKGGIVGRQTAGDVTSAFPDGVVVLSLEAPGGLTDADIGRTIRNSVNFPMGEEIRKKAGPPFEIAIEPVGAHRLALSGGGDDEFGPSAEEESYSKSRSHGYPLHYWLACTIIKRDENGLIARISFRGGWIQTPLSQGRTPPADSEAAPRWAKSEAPNLLSQTIDIRPGRIVLIGFPSRDFGPRGTVYWLAVQIIA